MQLQRLFALAQGHAAGLCSTRCPPAHPRPFLPSRFPAGQSPAHPAAWGSSSPAVGCAFGFADLHKTSLAHQSIRSSCRAHPQPHQCPSLWHPRETRPSAHPGPPRPRHSQSAPLTTAHPPLSLLRPPHLSLWASGISQRHSCHLNIQLKLAGMGSAGVWPQTFIHTMLCIKTREKHWG